MSDDDRFRCKVCGADARGDERCNPVTHGAVRARDEALEEAARICEEEARGVKGTTFGPTFAALEAADRIRALRTGTGQT